jgi:beta-barrel assembly-enhancing protease
VGRDEDIRVNGVPARSADLVGVSPVADSSGKEQRERDWLVSMRMSNGSLVYLVFIAPQNDYNNLRPTFEQMLRTFRLNQQ